MHQRTKQTCSTECALVIPSCDSFLTPPYSSTRGESFSQKIESANLDQLS